MPKILYYTLYLLQYPLISRTAPSFNQSKRRQRWERFQAQTVTMMVRFLLQTTTVNFKSDQRVLFELSSFSWAQNYSVLVSWSNWSKTGWTCLVLGFSNWTDGFRFLCDFFKFPIFKMNRTRLASGSRSNRPVRSGF